MTRDDLGEIAYTEFLRQMGGASSAKGPADSWAARGEANRENWRRIAEAVADAVRAEIDAGDNLAPCPECGSTDTWDLDVRPPISHCRNCGHKWTGSNS